MPTTATSNTPIPLALLVDHPRKVLFLFALLSLMLGWQARHFEINASADTLLTEDNALYLQSQVLHQRFSPQEFLLIAYQPQDHPVLSAQTFADLRSIGQQVRTLERVAAVRSILNVPLFSQEGAALSPEMDPGEATLERQNLSMEQLEALFRDHPIYQDLLINGAQTATALQVLFKPDPTLEPLRRRLTELQGQSLEGELAEPDQRELEQLKQRIAPLERQLDRTRSQEIRTLRELLVPYGDRAQLYLGGVHVLADQLIRIIKNDLLLFGGAIAVMICLMLLLLFRRLRWVLIPLVCCACSVLLTLGLFGLLGLKATVISANFIALQLILTLAIVIHLIVQYREYSTEHPHWSQTERVRRTLARKAAPCLYAGLTTSVGFGSLLFSGLQPVIAFGWMMMIAVLVSIITSLVLFPALMALGRGEKSPPPPRLWGALLGFFNRLCLHRIPVLLASLVLLAVGVAGALRLDVENSFIDYFHSSTRVHQELTFIDRQFGGTTPLDIVYTVPAAERHPDLVMTAATVQRLQRLQQALNQEEAVGKVLSVVNFTELAKMANAGKPLTEHELTALYWLLEESLREDLLGAFFVPDQQQARISVRIRDSTPGLDRAALLDRIRSEMDELGIDAEQRQLGSLFVLYQDILQRLFHSQILTLGIVYGALALTLLLIFGSLKIALIGIAPNILSTVVILGTMGWLHIPLDLMTITIAAITMGIAVDDTIHYTHRYREELAAGAEPAIAIARSHRSVGYAMLYTSLIITLGFLLLVFSDFVPSILFGLLTGIAMVVALITDLTLLPVLLQRFVRAP